MATPILSRTDRAAIGDVQRAMLAVLDFDDVNAWHRRVAQSLKPLLGADRLTFILPVDGAYAAFSDDVTTADMTGYPEIALPLDARWSMWDRVTSLGVWSGRTVWGPWWGEYVRTSYHNDFMVPRRFLDSIGVACVVGDATTRATADTTAGIWMHHESMRGPRFGARGAAILREVLPAWTAGIELWRRLQRHRAALGRLIDGLGVPILLATEYGVGVHRTPALRELLAHDPQGTSVLAEMAQLAGAFARARRSHGEPIAAADTRSDVRTATATYRMRASAASPELLGPGPIVVVVLERVTPLPPSLTRLAEVFELTPAQAEIAVLMAQGLEYAAIARTRACSIHTVRRHAEQVRVKLGVRTHPEVVARLRSVGG